MCGVLVSGIYILVLVSIYLSVKERELVRVVVMLQYYDSNVIFTNLLNQLHKCCHFTLEVAIRTMNSIVMKKEDMGVLYSSFLKVTSGLCLSMTNRPALDLDS